MPNIGPLEIVIVLVIVLLIFGPKRLPGLGKQLGSGMREFKHSVSGDDRADEPAAAAAEPEPAAVPEVTGDDLVPPSSTTEETEKQVFGPRS